MTLLIPLAELTVGVPAVLAAITHLTHRHHMRQADDAREHAAISLWLDAIRSQQ